MTPTRIRTLAAGISIAALTAALVAFPEPRGAAQEPKAARSEPLSALHCIGCHGGPESPAYKAYAQEKRTEFVRLDEYPIWHDQDLHAVAFEHLTPKPGTLAGRMQDVLKRVRPEGYAVNTAAECLTCHSVDRKPGPATGPAEGRFYTAHGVGCEACHGLVTDEWIGRHILLSWRDKTPAEKWEARQVDLRDPYTRAVKCASCHVGNLAEGKFVTHEMYAAGHPPLPPFEVATFVNDMPRHAYPPRENKALAAMPAETAWKNFHFRKGECAEARSVAVGTLAAFETSTRLLADVAKETKPGELLDFAVFDCWACHHDLKDPSWRQKRGYRGAPGRPVLHSYETLPVVLKHAEGANGVKTESVTKAAGELLAEWATLNKGFDTTPFGRPEDVAKQAGLVVAPCRALREELAPLVYDPVQTESLYRLLADRITKDGPGIDYDAAQQAVWGSNVIRGELGKTNNPKSDAALDLIMPLHVRGEKREPVSERLKARLDRIGKFDPDVFLPAARLWVHAK
jgi:hypothetical protein